MDWFSKAGLISVILGLCVIALIFPLLYRNYKDTASRVLVCGLAILVSGSIMFNVETDGWYFGVKVFIVICVSLMLIGSLIVLYREYKRGKSKC